MKNLWSDTDAQAAVDAWGPNADLAETVYATRLLGGDKALVLHGGGNTSVKTEMTDLFGQTEDVLCVKGSGRNMADMTPDGMTALKLAPVQRLADFDELDDATLVSAQTAAKLDAAAPSPSVEMLLHAFLPAKFICHTHANAVLALTNQSNWESSCREAFGDAVATIPYAMSGFAVAKAAKAAIAKEGQAEALLILRHGLFTFGDTAKQAYERMIAFVSMAEAAITRAGPKAFEPAALPGGIAPVADIAPILRGATAVPVNPEDRIYKPFILDFRTSDAIRAYVDGKDVSRYGTAGPGTPDFVIRTKPKALVVPAPEAGKLDAFKEGVAAAVEAYARDYEAYFERNNQRVGGNRIALDPMPRVVLVPGLGLFGLGRTKAEAAIAADLAEADVEIVSNAEALGTFESASEHDLFDIEYWALEQAKLAADSEKPLARHIAVVTGGASGIGLATAAMFKAYGCEVAVLDLSEEAAQEAATGFGGIGIGCDVTDADAVKAAVDQVSETFGGVDFLVSNAGAAWQGRIGEVDESVLRKSFELNFWGHQYMSAACVGVMTAQGIGGCLLYNTSKQALNPGKNFGPYGLPKAAALFLMKQYALDHGRDGIRANAVNADRIRSGLLTDDMIASRSQARGVTEKDYLSGNLLGLEVTADDVAKAFVDLALSRRTSAATLTVDGGNIEASLR